MNPDHTRLTADQGNLDGSPPSNFGVGLATSDQNQNSEPIDFDSQPYETLC